MWYYIIKSYHLYQKLFKNSLLIKIITIYYIDIFLLIKWENSLIENIIYQVFNKILKLILNITIFARL